jgi:hypothetical protein
MTYRGHIKNGEIKLDKPVPLPEGASVNVEVVEARAPNSQRQERNRSRTFQPIEMPGSSLADELIRDRR